MVFWLVVFYTIWISTSDFGVGLGVLNVPHYMGSAENYQWVISLSVVLKDKNVYFEDKNFYFGLASDLNLPVNAHDLNVSVPEDYSNKDQSIVQSKNYTRRGMKDLPLFRLKSRNTKM